MPELEGYRFDLHTHTKCSFDSTTSPRQLVKAAVRRGLTGLAITDHNSVDCTMQTRHVAGDELTVIPGIEHKTRQGDLIGLFVWERPVARNMVEAAEQIKQMDGLVVLPHPTSYFRGKIHSSHQTELIKKVDAIETFNARSILRGINRRAERLAIKFSKTRVGGSDAHTAKEVGRGYTVFACREEEDIRRAILSGHTDVGGTLSPFTVRFHSIVARIRKKTTETGLTGSELSITDF